MKWQRDPGIEELIDYFDQPGVAPAWDGKSGGWIRLQGKPSELAAIESEIRKCRQSFSYFARNYGWITTKERKEVPFRLFESQELLLERILELKSMGKAQKLLILKARQLGASTLVEGMITWRTVLFSNVNALIVSANPSHSVYLFNMMQFMYDLSLIHI